MDAETSLTPNLCPVTFLFTMFFLKCPSPFSEIYDKNVGFGKTFLAIFRNKIMIILTPLTTGAGGRGGHVFHFGGP